MSLMELAAEVAAKTGLSRKQAALCLRAACGRIVTAVKVGERVNLPQFGTFFPRDIQPMSAFGGRVQVRRRRKVGFRQSRSIP